MKATKPTGHGKRLQKHGIKLTAQVPQSLPSKEEIKEQILVNMMMDCHKSQMEI